MESNLIAYPKFLAMNKRTMVSILLLLAIVAVIYAVYKGTEATITTIDAGRNIVYGQPQHGLTLGLCVFAGFCVLGATLLLWDDRYRIGNDAQNVTTTTASSNRTASNYPR